MGISKRLFLGFGLVLLFLGVLAVLSYYKIDQIKSVADMAKGGIERQSFLFRKELDHKHWVDANHVSIEEMMPLEIEFDPHQCNFGQWLDKALKDSNTPSEVLAILKELEPIHSELHGRGKEISQLVKSYDRQVMQQILKAKEKHFNVLQSIEEALLTQNTSRLKDLSSCELEKNLKDHGSDDSQLNTLVEELLPLHQKLNQVTGDMIKRLLSSNYGEAKNLYLKELLPAFRGFEEKYSKLSAQIESLVGDNQKADETFQKIKHLMEKISVKFAEMHLAYDDYYRAQLGNVESVDTGRVVTEAQRFVSILGILSLIVGVVVAFLIGRSIINPVRDVTRNLESISSSVSNASNEVSKASEQLSNMSTEQASAVEETSSSLEEIDGMVQNNVTNAEEAARLSNDVSRISEKGNESMSKLNIAMMDILESNNKIVELVKVISNIGEKTRVMDEIVFQTKLLSFNASVEAERAGEYGRGFAVVAQEVGNLAQMSGKSAREIAEIVKESIRNAEIITTENREKVDHGSELVKETGKILREIMTASVSMSSGASQVLDASRDQAKGIKQINEAITQIDRVTQETAATAERTSGSSDVLMALTKSLNEVVTGLSQMVSGGGTASVVRKEKSIAVVQKMPTSESVAKPNHIAQSEEKKSPTGDGWESL